jgi:hypothetical protein
MEETMTLGAVLDVAIGITFFFALLAIIASSIQEIIASVLSTRGKVLQDMLMQILSHGTPDAAGAIADGQVAVGDPAPPVASDFAARVIDHPLISSLATANVPPWLSRIFNRLFGNWFTDAKLPSYVPSGNFATALIEALREGHDDTTAVGSQITRAIAALPANSAVRRILEGFLVETKGDIDAFRARLQIWYDDAMDRAGGVYKRSAQYMLLVIGLVMAVVINADVISIADTLWHDKAAREVVASAAQQYITSHPQPNGTVTPVATGATAGTNTDAPETITDAAATSAAVDQVKQASGVVATLPIPLGWGTSGDSATSYPMLILRKLVGFLLTGFAVSLGAPFWFDLLQNIANLRGAGPKPALTDGTKPN